MSVELILFWPTTAPYQVFTGIFDLDTFAEVGTQFKKFYLSES